MKLQAGTNHFHPLSWKIHLDFDSSDLALDPEAQSIFVHEYAHYLQFVVSAFGQKCLHELFRLTVYMAYQYEFGALIPKTIHASNRIDVLGVLASNIHKRLPTLFEKQITDHVDRLKFCFDANYQPVKTGDPRPATYPFVSQERIFYGKKLHVKGIYVPWLGKEYVVAITERVIFENMARELQRCFSIFAGPKAVARMEKYGVGVPEVIYQCIAEYLRAVLPKGEDASKWTYSLCQYSLRAPDATLVLTKSLALLRSSRNVNDLSSFISECDQNPLISRAFQRYSLARMNSELSHLSRGVLSITAGYDVHEVFKSLCTAYNEFFVDRKILLNYGGLFWPSVVGWVQRFGCPPIVFRDRTVDQYFSSQKNMVLVDYFDYVNKYYELHM